MRAKKSVGPQTQPEATADSLQKQAALALIYTAILLSVFEYFFLPVTVARWLTNTPPYLAVTVSLEAGAIWVAACFVGYLLLPYTVVKLWHVDRKWASVGANLREFFKHAKIYFGLYALMVPLIFIAAQMPEFQKIYPFVREATETLPKFITWELLYILQFISLEAFFRGYLLFSLERVMHRWVAIAVMTVPYTMIHFHKPFPETLGAIVAGCALGWLSLRYRSWAGGAMIHGLVAVTMDTISAHRAGLF